MQNYENYTINLGVNDIKEGLPYFYSDVGNTAILLASSNENKSLVPVELSPEKVVKYPHQRDKVKEINDFVHITENISRIQILDQLLEGRPFEDCDYNISDELTKSYVGEDWYLTIDKVGNINTYLMKHSNDQARASEEIEIIKEFLKEKGVEETYYANKTRN